MFEFSSLRKLLVLLLVPVLFFSATTAIASTGPLGSYEVRDVNTGSVIGKCEVDTNGHYVITNSNGFTLEEGRINQSPNPSNGYYYFGAMRFGSSVNGYLKHLEFGTWEYWAEGGTGGHWYWTPV